MDIKVFLETQPLYVKNVFDDLKHKYQINPEILTLKCLDECKKEQPFHNTIYVSAPLGLVEPTIKNGIHELHYICQGCKNQKYTFFLNVLKKQEYLKGKNIFISTSVEKVGQYPSWSVSISNELASMLGEEDAAFLRKAKLLMSYSHGLGALVYMRRIVENQINNILQLIHDKLKIEYNDEDTLTEILTIKNGNRFQDKMDIAHKYLPDLVVEGSNPIKHLHQLMSQGIKKESDYESLEKAMKIDETLRLIMLHLESVKSNKKKFSESMKEIETQLHKNKSQKT